MSETPAGEHSAPEQPLVDVIRKHTGQSDDEARATILRALDRALGVIPSAETAEGSSDE